MFLLLAPGAVGAKPAGPQAGQFYGGRFVKQVQDEAAKITEISTEAGNNPTISLSQISDKVLRAKLMGVAPSKLNMSGKFTELESTAKELEAALKAAKAGKFLEKGEIVSLQCHVQILKAFGEIEKGFGSGKQSLEKAFAKKADSAIRSIASLGEKGSREDKAMALQYLTIFRGFQNVPSVNLSLAKNAARLTKVEAIQQNSQALQFMNPQLASTLGEKAQSGAGQVPQHAAA